MAGERFCIEGRVMSAEITGHSVKLKNDFTDA